MVPLIDMPAEMLEEILLLLPTRDVSALSRTCSALHNFLSPQIYHDIDWYWEDDRVSPPYHLLLRTLLSNDKLANAVRTIKLRGGGIIDCVEQENYWTRYACDWDPTRQSRSLWTHGMRKRDALDVTDLWRMRTIVTNIDKTRVEKWMHEVRRGNVDVIVGLLLYQARSLRRLDLGFGLVQHSVFIPLTFRSLICTAPAYPRLTHVNIGLDGPWTPMNTFVEFDFIRIFFFMPKLAHLNAAIMEPVVFGWPSPTLQPTSYSLSELILERCTISGNTLERLLRCTPNLKKLVYDYRRMVAGGGSHWESWKECEEEQLRDRRHCKILLYCQPVTKALSHVKTTLEHLELKVHFEDEQCNGITDPWNSPYLCHLVGRVKDLDKLLKLKTLEISWALLMGWEPDLEEEVEMEQPGYQTWLEESCWDNDISSFPWASVLPPNVQYLLLRNDFSDFDYYSDAKMNTRKLVEDLVCGRSVYFPHLMQLDFLFLEEYRYRGRHEWLFQSMIRLLNICRTAAIACEMFREAVEGQVVKVSEYELSHRVFRYIKHKTLRLDRARGYSAT